MIDRKVARTMLSLLLAASLGIGCAATDTKEREAKVTDLDPEDPTALRCLNLLHVDRTDVIDDENIFFYMRDGTVYRNQLAHRCPGLRREDRFMYKPVGNRLCDLDTITVLTTLGGGLTSGATCGLGKFHAVPEEEVETLIEILRRDE